MLDQKYIHQAKELVRKRFPKNKAFIFGSSVRSDDFFDVDIAIEAVEDSKLIFALREDFVESTFPRLVDIVNFDKTDSNFREYVLNQEKKLWI